MLAEFFTAISTASSMKLSRDTVHVMGKYFPKFEPLPQFSMLSSLEASFFQSSWTLSPAFFGGCPNLQSLILDLNDYLGSEKQLIKLLDVRQGFFSTLKFVKLTMPLADRATPTNLALAAYFLRNCDVLEKLSVSAAFSFNILDQIKKVPKKSLRCEIVVVD
ncbi:F-box/FBD/LRR-repeat protein [Cardamine amara subsp. amara]|uniref:F-box/FBD/LRR-repeat protein n=1 Tax=Cardamine amara subsp. amara TaxID=228776 RepID=A0ABD1C3L3_CARAN